MGYLSRSEPRELEGTAPCFGHAWFKLWLGLPRFTKKAG